MVRLAVLMCVAASLASHAATVGSTALGLIIRPGKATIRRTNSEVSLAARTGDLLFAGDALRSEAESVTYLFCPEKALETLSPLSEIVIGGIKARVKSGHL